MASYSSVASSLAFVAALGAAGTTAVVNLGSYGPQAEATTIQYTADEFKAASSTASITLKTLSGEPQKMSAVSAMPQTAFTGTGIDHVNCTIGSATGGNEAIYLGATTPLNLSQIAGGQTQSGLMNGYDLTTPDTDLDVVLYCTAYGASSGADFAPHSMTAHDTPSPYVISTNSTFGANEDYEYRSVGAFDKNTTNAYLYGNQGNAIWVKIDFGTGNSESVYAYSVRGYQHVDDPTRAPKAWTLQGSNDDSNWDTLDTVTAQTGWTQNEERDFACDVTGSDYRYMKLNITDNNGDGSVTVLGELYLYGLAAVNFGNGSTTNLTAGKLWVRLQTTTLPDGD